MNNSTGPFSFPFLGYRGQGRLINHLAHEEFKTLGDKYGDLIFFKLFMDQPVVVVRGYDFIKVSRVRHFPRRHIDESTGDACKIDTFLAVEGTLNVFLQRVCFTLIIDVFKPKSEFFEIRGLYYLKARNKIAFLDQPKRRHGVG